MVKVQLPVQKDGAPDVQAWCRELDDEYPHLDVAQIREIANQLSPDGLRVGVEIADLLAGLLMDQTSVIAGLIH